MNGMNGTMAQAMRLEVAALSFDNWCKCASADEVFEEICKCAAIYDLSDEHIVDLLKTAGFGSNLLGSVKAVGQKAMSGLGSAASSIGSAARGAAGSVSNAFAAPATKRLAAASQGVGSASRSITTDPSLRAFMDTPKARPTAMPVPEAMSMKQYMDPVKPRPTSLPVPEAMSMKQHFAPVLPKPKSMPVPEALKRKFSTDTTGRSLGLTSGGPANLRSRILSPAELQQAA